MGYHIILHCTAIIHLECTDGLQRHYFHCEEEDIPEPYRDFYRIWHDLSICDDIGFYQFEVEGDQLTLKLSIRPFRTRHSTFTIERDYKRFMRDMIAPISSEIVRCIIEHDDYDIGPYVYTDEEVRSFF